jgi:tetratricopeptide (TPR) repeat protein
MACLLFLSLLLVSSSALRAQNPQAVTSLTHETSQALFTLYDAGQYEQFDRRVGELAGLLINPFDFEWEGDAWIGASNDQARRHAVAAAVSLELVRVLVNSGSLTVDPERYSLGPAVHPIVQMLFELGCAWIREQPLPVAERQWHRASLVLLRTEPRPGPLFGAPLAFASRDDETKLSDARARQRAIERNDLLSKQYSELRNQLRRSARHQTPTSRLSRLTPWPQHAKHVAARVPDEPLLALLPALAIEARNTSLQETLLVSRLSPVWLDEEKIGALAAAGRKEIEALSPYTRMDRASAEKLARVLPAPKAASVGSLTTLLSPGLRPTAVATSLALWDVVDVFRPLSGTEGIASEASLRLGQAYARLARPEQALDAFSRVLQRGGTPYEIYLTHIFRGAVLERLGRRVDALDAFRGALLAVPRAQSASLALAPLLLKAGARPEAAAVMAAAVRAPLIADPLEYYFLGDPQSSALELARLRQTLR